MLSFCLVSDADAVRSTLANVVRDFGKLDVFIANAGMSVCLLLYGVYNLTMTGMAISKPILEQTHEEYKKQMSVNGTSPTADTSSRCPPPTNHGYTSAKRQSTAYSRAQNMPARSSTVKAAET